MNIIYCYDNKIKYLLDRSKESFLRHNSNINFYEITEDKDNLLNEFTSELCGFTHVSKACFLRLLIPHLFSQLERALYVDVDTLCLGDISEFYNADFEDNYIMACRGIKFSDVQANQLGIPYYVNSGVLLFNIPLMNKEDYFKQIKDKWRGSLGKQVPYSADETIINWCFHDKIKLINEKYNYCYQRDYGNRAIKEQDVKIMHFTGRDKERMIKYKYD